MIRQSVYLKTTKKVLRTGYCDFENDGSYNQATENIEILDFDFNPCCDVQDWYWNGSTFQTDPP